MDDDIEMELSNPIFRERLMRAYRRVAQEVQRQAQLNSCSLSVDGGCTSGEHISVQEEAVGDSNQAPYAEAQELIYDQLRLF